MFESQVLDVFIGLIFLFLLVSIICTTVREGIEARLKTRAAYLEYGIRGLMYDMDGKGLAKMLYQHPLVFSLFSGEYERPNKTGKPGVLAKGNDLPSYIPASSFALALLDLAANGPADGGHAAEPASVTLEKVRSNIRRNLDNSKVERVVLSAIDAAQGDLGKTLHNIEVWYDSSMDRVAGWYRRSTQWIVFWISLFVAVALNINTITVADYLYTNDTARGVLLSQADHAAVDPDFAKKSYADVKNQLQGLGLPIGWSQGWGAPRRGAELSHDGLLIWNDLAAPILGWLFTVFAAMLGAPFWFDVLGRVMEVRSTVKPREKNPGTGSMDGIAPADDSSRRFVGAGSAATTSIATLQFDAQAGDNSTDGCVCGIHLDAADMTRDDQLPAAQGGVA